MERKYFIRISALAAAAWINPVRSFGVVPTFPRVRIPADKRLFTSAAVEDTIISMQTKLNDEELGWLFENCFPNTLDTTVFFTEENGVPDTFVITGDINAMWLRDSSAQVMPYIPLLKNDPQLKALIAGVIRRQARCINIDPYANAFNKGPDGSPWSSDTTEMKPELHERKWEVDSLCYTIRLAYEYWKETGDTAPFDKVWRDAMIKVVQTFKEQQRKKDNGPYSFKRPGSIKDTLSNDGYGNPVKPVGLICSSFRPSDDATKYPFHIPSNFFAVISLKRLAEMSEKIHSDHDFAKQCKELADEVDSALQRFAVVRHEKYGEIYAYEIDGLGNHVLMDDANVPNLLGMPYLGSCDVGNATYQATRKFALSEANPYYFAGSAAKGIGSPHTFKRYIWPLGIIMQAMTSTDKKEIQSCIAMLKVSHGGTGFMHESFDMDNPKKYSRKWFAWANTLFGEMLLKVTK